MLDRDLRHRKVPGVPGRQPRADSRRRGGDEAVGLTQRDPFAREAPPPAARELALGPSERCDPQPREEGQHRRPLARADSPRDLLHVDGAYPRDPLGGAQGTEPLGGRPAPQRVDQDGGVEEEGRGLTLPAPVAVSLFPDPGGRIAVPIVLGVLERPEGGDHVIPATLVLQRQPNGLGDKATATARADPAIELGYELVLKTYVQSHAHKLSHYVAA